MFEFLTGVKCTPLDIFITFCIIFNILLIIIYFFIKNKIKKIKESFTSQQIIPGTIPNITNDFEPISKNSTEIPINLKLVNENLINTNNENTTNNNQNTNSNNNKNIGNNTTNNTEKIILIQKIKIGFIIILFTSIFISFGFSAYLYSVCS